MIRSVIVFFLLCLVMGVTYFIKLNAAQSNAISDVILSECRLSESNCEVSLSEDTQLSFALQPKSLPAMEPISLSITGVDAEFVYSKAWFEGKEMNMGKHFLIPEKPDMQTANTIALTGMIPVCHVDDAMIWRLVAEFNKNNERVQIHFEQRASSN